MQGTNRDYKSSVVSDEEFIIPPLLVHMSFYLHILIRGGIGYLIQEINHR